MTHSQGASDEWVYGLQIWENDHHRAAIDYDYYRS